MATYRNGSVLVVGDGETLPPRCIKCNAPACGEPIKYTFVDSAVNGAPHGVVTALIHFGTRRTGRVNISLCEGHRRVRALIRWGCPLIILLVFALGIYDNVAHAKPSDVLEGVGIALVVGCIFPLRYLHNFLRGRVQDREMCISGAGERFLESLAADQPSATPSVSRDFSRTDGNRKALSVAIFVIVGACYWFMLPLIQSHIISNAPGGTTGPWVLRPILADHIFAVVVMAGVTVPFIVRVLGRKRQPAVDLRGNRGDLFAGRPVDRVFFVLKEMLLLIIYAALFMFYLLSWETIGPDGIEEHLPWATLHHSFQDIESLETVPDGERSDSLEKDGPWYLVTLRDGRNITWSLDNEGTTPNELTAMTAFIAERSGIEWEKKSDRRAR